MIVDQPIRDGTVMMQRSGMSGTRDPVRYLAAPDRQRFENPFQVHLRFLFGFIFFKQESRFFEKNGAKTLLLLSRDF
jgi:hypothetical protein